MAVQQWTILKLVGPAAEDAASRFERWWRARRSTDSAASSPDYWRPSIRRAAANYVADLEAHRWTMPVAYFSQHVDLWLTGAEMQFHLGDAQARVWHDGGELWCYRLPDRGRLVRRSARPASLGLFPETEWLAARLVEAARAYDKLWREATLLVNRKAITASPSDEELKASAATLPKWIGRSGVR